MKIELNKLVHITCFCRREDTNLKNLRGDLDSDWFDSSALPEKVFD